MKSQQSHYQFRAVLALSVSSLWVTPATADNHNRLFGCVTDRDGRAVSQATVIARSDRVTGLAGKWEWKAKVQPDTGCYEMPNLPDAVYVVHLEDRRYNPHSAYIAHIGPTQGIVALRGGEERKLDAKAELPDPTRLAEGIATAVANSATGFTALRQALITTPLEAVTYGGGIGWYLAPIISGFHTCATGRFSAQGREFESYSCDLKYLDGVAFAKEMFIKTSAIITSSLDEKFGGFTSPRVECVAELTNSWSNDPCFERAEWVNGQGLSVDLIMYRGKKEEYLINLGFLVTHAPDR